MCLYIYIYIFIYLFICLFICICCVYIYIYILQIRHGSSTVCVVFAEGLNWIYANQNVCSLLRYFIPESQLDYIDAAAMFAVYTIVPVVMPQTIPVCMYEPCKYGYMFTCSCDVHTINALMCHAVHCCHVKSTACQDRFDYHHMWHALTGYDKMSAHIILNNSSINVTSVSNNTMILHRHTMCIYIYIYICIHTYIYIYIYMYVTHTHTCVYISLYIYIYIYTLHNTYKC